MCESVPRAVASALYIEEPLATARGTDPAILLGGKSSSSLFSAVSKISYGVPAHGLRRERENVVIGYVERIRAFALSQSRINQSRNTALAGSAFLARCAIKPVEQMAATA